LYTRGRFASCKTRGVHAHARGSLARGARAGGPRVPVGRRRARHQGRHAGDGVDKAVVQRLRSWTATGHGPRRFEDAHLYRTPDGSSLILLPKPEQRASPGTRRRRNGAPLRRLALLRSGRPGSNRRPLAWKANALPTELLPLRSARSKGSRSTKTNESPAVPQSGGTAGDGAAPRAARRATCRTRTDDRPITNRVLYQLS
jgi:hypothetical protein